MGPKMRSSDVPRKFEDIDILGRRMAVTDSHITSSLLWALLIVLLSTERPSTALSLIRGSGDDQNFITLYKVIRPLGESWTGIPLEVERSCLSTGYEQSLHPHGVKNFRKRNPIDLANTYQPLKYTAQNKPSREALYSHRCRVPSRGSLTFERLLKLTDRISKPPTHTMNFPGPNTRTNPPLPRRRNIALPVTSGNMRPQDSIIDIELAATERIRPVARPRLTNGPADIRVVIPGTIITIISGQFRNINFISNAQPATNPPVRGLWLTFPNHNVHLIRSAVEDGDVSVYDVQRAVIEWMRQQPQSNNFYRREIIAREGTTVAVWVWAWRGLVQIGNDTTRWSVELGFDV
ncbi:hypothetical protein P691DRAFT_791979 [Macrolepiota fuliginosa MF-IS2]|uniref:Uncharacterized protein n=1 Tax=Macrolepiota fuliginosa MF-IS2 TaxID=1400762 RepID=A0A9P5XGI2_9AGAR|nr:hypothetical protein P691DRAFT_791979 [Macrolepiota fuliginosa MF-IS2]